MLRQDIALGYHNEQELKEQNEDDLVNEEALVHRFTFHPHGWLTSVWGLVSSLMLIYITVVLPVRIAFDMKVWDIM